MNARYSTPITRREAERFVRMYFGTPRFRAGDKYVWVAGIHYVNDQPGCYLIATPGGLEGVRVEQIEFPSPADSERRAS